MDFRGFNSAPAGMHGDLPGLNVDFTYNPAEERAVAVSVAQELDYLEKVVFSFDMDRDPSKSSGNPGQPSRSNEDDRAGQSRDANSSSASGSQTNPRGYFDQIDPQLLGALYSSTSNTANHPPSMTAPTNAPPPGLSPLDPYMIAHAAALSALASAPQQSQPFPGQRENPDPFAFLRAMYAYGGPNAAAAQPPALPPGFPLSPPSQTRPTHSTISSQPQPPVPQWLSHLSQPPGNAQAPLSRARSQSHTRILPPLTAPSLLGSRSEQPEAGPSQPRGRTQSLTQTQSARSSSEPDLAGLDEPAVAEDKRRRNTAASGLFYFNITLDNH